MLKAILAGIVVLAALYDYTHTKWMIAKFGECVECNKAARIGPFSSIVGVALIWTLLLSAIPSPLPLAFYAGMRANLFYMQRVAKTLLAE